MDPPVAIGRAQRFAEATDILIPMRYELDLLWGKRKKALLRC
jgi:sugar/nucleoside kinase (ribokinase family)